MLRKFLKDVRGNYLIITGIVVVPLMGGLALSIDYVNMSRQRQDTLNALDAAAIATARRVLEGASDAEVKKYAWDFFEANLGAADPKDAKLTVKLPDQNFGGGSVKLTAELDYHPHFLPAFRSLLNGSPDGAHAPLKLRAESEVKLKNTVEVALVLDNSGSMAEYPKGSSQKRIDLLKSAATQLVDRVAATAQIMKQVEKPVQFSVVPFAASVNIGSGNANEAWMDRTGISPIHHENFNWTAFSGSNKKIQQQGNAGPYYKKGSSWGAEEGDVVTRFTLFNELKRYACNNGGTNCSSPSLKPYASWGGCVEARPYPYNTNDEPATPANPATLYVPMFGPDETDLRENDWPYRWAENNWWADRSSSNSKNRQRYTPKYFEPAPVGTAASGVGEGPNASCTTAAITPLTDVTKTTGMNTIKAAINAMQPLGATNVPEGMAWGWRTLSSQAPFTGGRSETERGNDKVVIVLTDGANTYYTPSSLGYGDLADNKTTYSAYGYGRLSDGNAGRIFSGTSSKIDKGDFSNDNYTDAMNEHFAKLCENANGGETGGEGAGLIVMTVAVDLDSKNKAEKGQIDLLEKCASRSRYNKDPKDPAKGKKLFWNAKGTNLEAVFKEIADELSNLRIVS